jgi:tight adherence protein B
VIGPALPAFLLVTMWTAIAVATSRARRPILAGSVRAARPAPSGTRSSVGRLARSRAAWALLGAAAGWLVVGPSAALVAALIAGVAHASRARRSERGRAAAMDEGMSDGVRAIAAGLRAGLSVPQALRFAAAEATPPLDATLAELVDAADVGEPLDDALHRWATQVGTADARLVEGVLGLHRRSGGDLPRVLDRVAETLRDRRAIAREVRALTAQARLSGAILGLLPVGFFAFLWLTSRRDIEGAFRTPAGLAALGAGAVLELLAFLWIRRLLEVR